MPHLEHGIMRHSEVIRCKTDGITTQGVRYGSVPDILWVMGIRHNRMCSRDKCPPTMLTKETLFSTFMTEFDDFCASTVGAYADQIRFCIIKQEFYGIK